MSLLALYLIYRCATGFLWSPSFSPLPPAITLPSPTAALSPARSLSPLPSSSTPFVAGWVFVLNLVPPALPPMISAAGPTVAFIIPVPTSLQSRNNRTGRLPTYRSTYMGRFHPYARFVSPKRRNQERMKTEDGLHDDEDSSSEMVAAPVYPRVCTCTEILERDTHLYEDDPLSLHEDEAAADTYELNVPRASKVAAIINDVFAALKRKYLSILAAKRFFGAE
ncbi:hypothetical protein C8Q73DRAFT_244756 [Cubamyces lactineus]|nr:hypothetical protein C8Q73DRAFT_244756 [Cubamyces lactineus]